MNEMKPMTQKDGYGTFEISQADCESSPLASVVMSVYNGQPYVNKSIESVLNQTFRDFEFIIVDDGSTDATSEILEQYRRKDSRIRLISQSNMGLTKSLNRAIGVARGSCIARQDADDISVRSRLAEQISFLQKGYDFCCCRTRFKHDGSIHPRWFSVHLYPALMKYKNVFIHGTYCFKKNVWKQLQGYDDALLYAQDYDFVVRLMVNSYRIKYLSRVLYVSVKDPMCISKINLTKQKMYFNQVRRRYFSRSTRER